MKLYTFIKTFARDEDGAVTVDWVVLTAAIVGLGIAVLTSVSGGTTSLADKISGELGTMTIMTTKVTHTSRTGPHSTGCGPFRVWGRRRHPRRRSRGANVPLLRNVEKNHRKSTSLSQIFAPFRGQFDRNDHESRADRRFHGKDTTCARYFILVLVARRRPRRFRRLHGQGRIRRLPGGTGGGTGGPGRRGPDASRSSSSTNRSATATRSPRRTSARCAWPKDAIPEGSFSDARRCCSRRAKSAFRTALRTMEKDEAVLAVKVTDPGQDAGVAVAAGERDARLRDQGRRHLGRLGLPRARRPGRCLLDRPRWTRAAKAAQGRDQADPDQSAGSSPSTSAPTSTAPAHRRAHVTVEGTPHAGGRAQSQAQLSGRMTLSLVGHGDTTVAAPSRSTRTRCSASSEVVVEVEEAPKSAPCAPEQGRRTHRQPRSPARPTEVATERSEAQRFIRGPYPGRKGRPLMLQGQATGTRSVQADDAAGSRSRHGAPGPGKRCGGAELRCGPRLDFPPRGVASAPQEFSARRACNLQKTDFCRIVREYKCAKTRTKRAAQDEQCVPAPGIPRIAAANQTGGQPRHQDVIGEAGSL